MVRGALAAAIVVAGLGAGWATAAPAQSVEPTVTIAATDGSASSVVDCKGAHRSDVGAAITVTVSRTGGTVGPLSVSLAYSGPLAGTIGLPSQVTIPAGSPSASVTADDASNGFVGIDVVDTNDYAVGAPGHADAQVLFSIADLGCNIGNPSSEQTIAVGTTPAAVDVVKVAYGPPDSLERSVVGTAPTGTTFHLDGTWSGTATEVGDFFLREYFCESDGWCPYRADVTVHVVPADVRSEATPPTIPAAPAAPVQGSAQLTG
jgi:hypothetical protein